VKTLFGKTAILNLSESDYLSDIKAKISVKFGITEDKQKLIFLGKVLEDPVDYYNLRREGLIFLIVEE